MQQPLPPEVNTALISGLASIITAVVGVIIRAIEKPIVIRRAKNQVKNESDAAQSQPSNN